MHPKPTSCSRTARPRCSPRWRRRPRRAPPTSRRSAGTRGAPWAGSSTSGRSGARRSSPSSWRSEPAVATIRDWSNFIAGRVAIVTGGGGGVGRAICIQLARAGAEVWVNDLYGDRAEKVVREIEEEGGAAHPVVADVTDRDAVPGMVRATGPVDILVNNAGIPPEGITVKNFVETGPDEWDPLIRLNLAAVLGVTRAYLPARRAQAGRVRRGEGRRHGLLARPGRRGRPARCDRQLLVTRDDEARPPRGGDRASTRARAATRQGVPCRPHRSCERSRAAGCS